jgi:tetratricopeptide (TPR) repeat protein
MPRRRFVAASILACCLLPAGHALAQERLPAAYLSALASYRAGDLASAFTKLDQLDEPELLDVTKRLLRRDVAAGSNWPRLLTAAILLHTEAFLIRAEAGPAPPSDPYFSSAYTMVRRLLELADDKAAGAGATERTFVRDWYLLLVALQHGRGEVGWSRALLTEALRAFPKEPNLTIALASDHEMLSDVSAGFIRTVDTTGSFRRDRAVDAGEELREAIRLFSQVTVTTPDMVEARLRLGRLLYRRGELDAAARELAAARSLTTQGDVVYLIALFSGMVEAARGDYQGAGTFYAEARRLMPQAQSVIVAEAETAYLSGRAGEAAATIQKTLRQAEKQDPWWGYMMGEWWHFESRLASIRRYVQR